MNMTATEYRASVETTKRSKYRNKSVVLDGERFDSKAEAARWSVLQLRQKAGEIAALRRQPRYQLHAYGGDVIGEYRGDFEYLVPNEGMVVEDVKGVRTALYRWKKKHYEAEYKIKITEIG